MRAKHWGLVSTLILGLMVSLFAAGCGSSKPAAKEGGTAANFTGKKFIRIATAQLGGGTYNHGLALCTVSNPDLKEFQLEALPTSGVVESARMLRKGEVEIASLGSDVTFDLYKGLGRNKGNAWQDARLLFPQFGTYVNIIVPKNSPIKSFADMKGKKIGVGNPGSAGYYLITHILRAHGLNEGDYKEVPLAPSEQTDALKDGHLDVYGFYTTPNSPSIVELATTLSVRWIDIDKEKWNAYASKNQLPFTVATIPAGSYRGMDKETAMISGMQMYVTTKDMPEEMAYKITKAFFAHFDDAVKIVAAITEAKKLLPAAAPTVPWHPGSVKYFQEAGLKYVEYKQ